MMKAKRRENGKGEVQYFAGLVKCADCGSSLNVSYDQKRGRYTGFSCWGYQNYYEDAALERISEEQYQSMASAYEREQEALWSENIVRRFQKGTSRWTPVQLAEHGAGGC